MKRGGKIAALAVMTLFALAQADAGWGDDRAGVPAGLEEAQRAVGIQATPAGTTESAQAGPVELRGDHPLISPDHHRLTKHSFVATDGSSLVEQVRNHEPTMPSERNKLGVTGEKLFLVCAGCHSLDATNSDLVGPHLAGIVGRRAAALEDYPYSKQLAAATFVWERNVLFSWILATESMVPGTHMLYHNHLTPEEVFRLIDFLEDSTVPEATDQ